MKKHNALAATAVSVAALGFAAGIGSAAAETELLVYTAAALEELERHKRDFEKEYPDISIQWLKPGSTGVLVARLLAEKDNPQADVIYGVGASHIAVLDEAGILEPYKPAHYEEMTPKFRDPANNPPHWIGFYGYLSTVCYNSILGESEDVPQPASWKDLTDPVYRGKIVMPSPAASGTGFLAVSSWLQMFGWDEGWAYMDALDENIAYYERSGSKPCLLAAQGEFPVGISFAWHAAREKSKGAPIEVISPEEGLGWELNAAAIHKGTDNLEAAQKFMDWVSSKGAAEMYNEFYAIVAHPDVAKPIEHYPENPYERMINNDFAWASSNRERILEEWTRRYQAKIVAE